MNLLKTICALALLTAVFTGCDQIDEDMEACRGEAVIRFDYPYNGQLTYFLDRIRSVKVGIFRVEDDVLVEDRFIPHDSLVAFQGMRVNLPTGKYKAVLWGDANDHTAIDWYRQLTYNPELFDIKDAADEDLHTDDDLDYSSIVFEVKNRRDANEVDTAHFEPAHITFEIDVVMPEGLPLDFVPALSIDKLNTEVYDFDMKESSTNHNNYTFYPIRTMEPREDASTAPEKGGYVLTETDKGAVYVLETTTRTHRLDNDNPVVINLFRNSARAGEPIKQLKLSDYISENQAFIVPKKECTFHITFMIGTNATINIYPLPWQKIGVDPIFPNTRHTSQHS
ncbi:MAG: FimB/Mfa2 family fimbrial subunit [Prevotellaceae bacterium]|jgi:hypothetical protein|nr:FimB/Mfa2 family fimbrial subunit [Prevotellaceae bacterium]